MSQLQQEIINKKVTEIADILSGMKVAAITETLRLVEEHVYGFCAQMVLPEDLPVNPE